jgi:hypothetical protein
MTRIVVLVPPRSPRVATLHPLPAPAVSDDTLARRFLELKMKIMFIFYKS